MLSPAPDSPSDIPLVPLCRASLGLYPDFLAEIEDVSGRRVNCRRNGAIEVLFSADAERELSTLIALHRGLGLATEPLPVDEARKLEPALGREVRAAALLPYEGCVDNRELTQAVLAAAAASGVEIHSDSGVTELLLEPSGHTCTGAAAGKEKYIAGNIVLAAGAFSGQIAGLDPPVPTRPIRGQMVALRASGFKLSRVLRSEQGYLVPRNDADPQWVVAGSTLEDAGFDRRVTPRGLEKIFSAIQELAPALAGAEVFETWSGLRPDTPDHLPLLGPAELRNLTLATGHYRNGILLAPVTAKLVREWITEQRVSLDWDIFSPLRFAGTRTARPSRHSRGRLGLVFCSFSGCPGTLLLVPGP